MFNCDFIRIELTNRCNLNCNFCYAKANSRIKINDEINTENLKLLIKKFKSLGGKKVLFTGGECLLRKDIYELLHYTKSLNLNTLMFTNGTLLTESVAIKIKNYVDYIYISLDGDKKKHEYSRGVKGCFDSVKNSFDILKKFNIPFAIETVVNDSTFTDLDWLDKFINEYNIRNIIIAPIYINNKITLSYENKKSLIKVIYKKNEQYNYRVNFQSNLHNKYDILMNYENLYNCITPWVLADGTIMPFLTYKKEWIMGTIDDYINDNLNVNIINKRKKILDKVYNIAITRDIFDIQEIINESI